MARPTKLDSLFASTSRVMSLAQDKKAKLFNWKAALASAIEHGLDKADAIAALLELADAHGLERSGCEVLINEAYAYPPEMPRVPPLWVRKDFIPTTEAMLQLWLQVSEEADFRYSGTQWLMLRAGTWQHDESGAALGRAIGAFQRKVGSDVKRSPRKEIESSRMHSGMTMRARAELARPVEDFDAADLAVPTVDGIFNREEENDA